MSDTGSIPTLDDRRVVDVREQVRERLLAQAHLFDDPATYRSGIIDAFEALESRDR